ncbi:MAG: hypothetical protein HC852_02280 [Acaryochloridaceae cyanobacterium RU_4_10]|nr:hypothetical protein [Acaryochloridaceae cyanobacterium RU_4_10]
MEIQSPISSVLPSLPTELADGLGLRGPPLGQEYIQDAPQIVVPPLQVKRQQTCSTPELGYLLR